MRSTPLFAIVAAISVAVGIGFGLAPAWHSARDDANVSLKDEACPTSGTRHQQYWMATHDRLGKSRSRSSCSQGPDSWSAVCSRCMSRASAWRAAGDRDAAAAARDQVSNLARSPGVHASRRRAARPEIAAIEMSSTTSHAPLGGGAAVQLTIDGRQTGTADRAPLVTMVAVGSRYFDVLRSPLLRGRSFTDSDGLPGRDVAIVNRRFADILRWSRSPRSHCPALAESFYSNGLGTPSVGAHHRRRVTDDPAAEHARARPGSSRLRSAAGRCAVQSSDAPRAHRAQ